MITYKVKNDNQTAAFIRDFVCYWSTTKTLLYSFYFTNKDLANVTKAAKRPMPAMTM